MVWYGRISLSSPRGAVHWAGRSRRWNLERLLQSRPTWTNGRAHPQGRGCARKKNEKSTGVKDVPGLKCQRCVRPFNPDVPFHRCLLSLGIVESPTRGCPTRPGGTNLLDSRGLCRCSQAPYPYDAYPQIDCNIFPK